MKKLSAAQMQAEEIKMRKERQTAIMQKINSIPCTSSEKDEEGDADFGRMVGKQVHLVGVSFCKFARNSGKSYKNVMIL